jgi:hypothetical protein
MVELLGYFLRRLFDLLESAIGDWDRVVQTALLLAAVLTPFAGVFFYLKLDWHRWAVAAGAGGITVVTAAAKRARRRRRARAARSASSSLTPHVPPPRQHTKEAVSAQSSADAQCQDDDELHERQ